MITFEIILLLFLIACALVTCLSKNLFSSIMIFESYSAIMCVIWLLLRAPDLAITEAAVGAGVTGVLFYITLKNVKQLKEEDEENEN